MHISQISSLPLSWLFLYKWVILSGRSKNTWHTNWWICLLLSKLALLHPYPHCGFLRLSSATFFHLGDITARLLIFPVSLFQCFEFWRILYPSSDSAHFKYVWSNKFCISNLVARSHFRFGSEDLVSLPSLSIGFCGAVSGLHQNVSWFFY